jgi:hypothetical protein
MTASTVLRRLFPLQQTIVSHHLRHPQPIVLEHPAATGRLRSAMLVQLPPRLHGRFIPPER